MRRKSHREMRLVFIIESAGKKTITLYENHTCPAMCPILHFVAIAFAHNAFPQACLCRAIPYTLHNFSSPDGPLPLTSPSGTTSLRSPPSAAPHGQWGVYLLTLSRLYPPIQFRTGSRDQAKERALIILSSLMLFGMRWERN